MCSMYYYPYLQKLNLYLVAITNIPLTRNYDHLDSCNFQIHDLEIITEKIEGTIILILLLPNMERLLWFCKTKYAGRKPETKYGAHLCMFELA